MGGVGPVVVTGDKMSSVATVCPVADLACGTRIVCQRGGGRLTEDAGCAEYFAVLLAPRELGLHQCGVRMRVRCWWQDSLFYRQTAHDV